MENDGLYAIKPNVLPVDVCHVIKEIRIIFNASSTIQFNNSAITGNLKL